jgi:hypothetical protein
MVTSKGEFAAKRTDSTATLTENGASPPEKAADGPKEGAASEKVISSHLPKTAEPSPIVPPEYENPAGKHFGARCTALIATPAAVRLIDLQGKTAARSPGNTERRNRSISCHATTPQTRALAFGWSYLIFRNTDMPSTIAALITPPMLLHVSGWLFTAPLPIV